jgi:hypothetical protein
MTSERGEQVRSQKLFLPRFAFDQQRSPHALSISSILIAPRTRESSWHADCSPNCVLTSNDDVDRHAARATESPAMAEFVVRHAAT